MSVSRRSTNVYVALVTLAGGLVCAHSAWRLAHGPVSMTWLALLALTVAAGWATLRVPAMPISFAISDTFTIVTALVVGPAAGALTAALDGLVLSFRMANDRRTPPRVLFNMGSLALATWLASQAFFALGAVAPAREGAPGAVLLVLRLAVFGVLHFAINSGLVAVAVACERGRGVSAIWREHFASLWLSSLGGVFAALLMMKLPQHSALETLILIGPLPVILYITLRQALGRAEDQISHLGKMNGVYLATIEALAQAVDAKDHVTHDHVRRVQENALRLAAAVGVADDAELQAINAASLLHDIGKIAIPEHILNKPGKLTPPEFEVMKRHAAIGAEILAVIGFPYPLVPIVRHHHENWDGTGYPDGVAGEAIPIGARILQVVDCFDALTSDRPYRPAMTEGEALQIVVDRRGTMYDPRIVDALVALHASGGCLAPTSTATTGSAAAAAVAAPVAAEPCAPAVGLPRDAFARLGRLLSRTSEPRLIGTVVWPALEPVVPASAFALFQYDAGADALALVYAAGEHAFAPGETVPLGDRVSGWTAATRRPAINSDARLDFQTARYAETPLRSVVAVPMLAEGELVGVMALYAREATAFGDAHVEALTAAAGLAATRLHAVAPPLRALA